MKKLLVLLVVLGLVSVANAGVIDLSITASKGVATPAATKSVDGLVASDYVTFQIVWNAPAGEYLFGIQSFINIDGPGTLDWGIFNAATWDPDAEAWVYDDLRNSFDVALHAIGQESGKTYILEGAASTGRNGTGSETYAVKDIRIHVEGPGQINVTLSNRGLGSKAVNASLVEIPWSYGNGIVINPQAIPEPMTMMLLGLGSLFLVKRKK